MWLIDVETRRLQEFIGVKTPDYAILSHTWVNGQEITFQEMVSAAGQQPEGSIKSGWEKIDRTCLQAARDGLTHAWVDTCCINKTSSAELSEAINSMFHWYKRAAVCYVFLEDLTVSPSALQPMDDGLRASIGHCRWFTRSWTLQELIAPLHIHFFNQDWEFCFTKITASAVLTRITGIDVAILEHKKDLSAVSVAQKMSWAATRLSTRIEDAAYSLLGIFEINMPLLYGEEERAFLRLQAEIVSSCPDSTILAWMLPDDDPQNMVERSLHLYSGVMASSPRFFLDCADIERMSDQSVFDYSMSNRGIKLRAQFGLCPITGTGGSCLVLPVCRVRDRVYGIRLRNVGRGSFARQDPDHLDHIRPWEVAHRLVLDPFLLKQLPSRSLTTMQTQNLVLESRKRVMQIVLSRDLEVYRRWPWQQWDEQDTLFFGSEESLDDIGWAAVKIVALPPNEFFDADSETHGSVDFLFYAFGWTASATSQTKPRCSIHRVSGSIEDRAIEQMNNEAVNDSWNAYWVSNRLLRHGVGEQLCLVAATAGTDALLLRCTVHVVEDLAISFYPFWRVEFDWEVVPKRRVPRASNRGWMGINWGSIWNPPSEDQ